MPSIQVRAWVSGHQRSAASGAAVDGPLSLHGGLVEEVPARGALPVWRRDDDAGPLALRITSDGLAIAAIGVEAGVAGREITAQRANLDATKKT